MGCSIQLGFVEEKVYWGDVCCASKPSGDMFCCSSLNCLEKSGGPY